MGTAGIPYENSNIVGHAKCLLRFSNDVSEKLNQKKESDPGKWDAVKLIAPNITFEEELNVKCEIGNLILHYLPGHTADSIVAFLP